MNCDDKIDPETRAFIRRTLDLMPADARQRDLAGQRRAYADLCRAFNRGRPEGVAVTDVLASGVPCRLYVAGDPSVTVVWFHGGGFVMGGLDSHDDICAEICGETGYRVLSVDYRLAPEHKHPAAFNDALTATRWAAAEFGDPLVLAGDSAGGNLAAAVAHAMRGHAESALGQVLIYPVLGADPDTPSAIEHADAPLLSRDDLIYFRDVRLAGPVPDDDPTFAPLLDADFADLPPTVVVTADCDPLRDDGRIYVERITDAGGQAAWIDEEGLVHGFLRARSSVERAQHSFERIVLTIEALGQGLWSF